MTNAERERCETLAIRNNRVCKTARIYEGPCHTEIKSIAALAGKDGGS